MSGTYKANGGESWSTVARVTTGNDVDAAAIRRANQGITEPIPDGSVVQVPMQDTANDAATGDGLEIRVNGQKLGTVSDFELLLGIDACSKGGFSVPNAPEMRDMFEPLSFPVVTIDYDGHRLFTGRASTPLLDNAPDAKIQSVEIWSIAAILERTSPPFNAFPLEWSDATFRQIADELAAHHGVPVRYNAENVARFKRVDIKTDEMVLEFLSGLAAQRGLILSDNSDGELVVHDGTGGQLVSYLEKGLHPTEEIDIQIDDSRYFSTVSVSMPAKSRRGKGGKRFDVNNPLVIPGIIRPYNHEAKDIDEGELETAAHSIAGRMFAELVTGSASVSTWKNDMGGVYLPGQLVKLKSPEDRIYNPFEFLVTMVSLRKTADQTSAGLNLSLPGVYSGEIPWGMPWQR